MPIDLDHAAKALLLRRASALMRRHTLPADPDTHAAAIRLLSSVPAAAAEVLAEFLPPEQWDGLGDPDARRDALHALASVGAVSLDQARRANRSVGVIEVDRQTMETLVTTLADDSAVIGHDARDRVDAAQRVARADVPGSVAAALRWHRYAGTGTVVLDGRVSIYSEMPEVRCEIDALAATAKVIVEK